MCPHSCWEARWSEDTSLPHVSTAGPGLFESRAQALQQWPSLSLVWTPLLAHLPDEILCVYLHNDEISVPVKSISLQTASSKAMCLS